MTLSIRLALAAVLVTIAACSREGGGGRPEGPLKITGVKTPTGERRAAAAECVGFTIRANADEVTFIGATATLGEMPLPIHPSSDAKELRIASEDETRGVCFFLPVFVQATGALPITVTSETGTWTLEDAFTVEPLEAFDVGFVAKEKVWSRDVVDAPGANVFERAWDVDVYRATFTDEYHVYDDVDFFPIGGDIVPELQIWSDRFPDAYLGRGGMGLVFPQSGTQLVVVRDARGMGGDGMEYGLAFTGDELGGKTPSDACDGAPEMNARAIHVSYDELRDDFDPEGDCVDDFYGTPIVGAGRDAVWRVRVPAGAELRASSYDDHLDSVLWIMDPDDGCPRRPACLAAAGRFGGGNTDTLVWTNDGDSEREVLLVHDAVREPELEEGEDEVGSFLLDVEIFE